MMSNEAKVIVDKLRQLSVDQLREVRDWIESHKRKEKEVKNAQKLIG